MKPTKFDELTKSLATATSRRQALKAIAATTFGSILGLSGIGTAFGAPKCHSNGLGCDTNSQCCSGYCQNGEKCTCPPAPACTVPPNNTCPCPSGQTCLNGSCCPTDQVCGSSCGCPSGQICSNGQCVTPTTTTTTTTTPPPQARPTCGCVEGLGPVLSCIDAGECESTVTVICFSACANLGGVLGATCPPC